MKKNIIPAALLFTAVLFSASSAMAVEIAQVPEPSTLLLLSSGVVGAGVWKIRAYLRK
ncbi:MAG: PEP-CTERM sorting domain-containing protein [Proteobacteria bacterium]|nr:PEP-CTERM sorting domain-containing protein [Pseudomonadota bacterium]